jgi:hypothetical protein
LGEQRSEWQQRIQATLYHHGCPQRRQLMVGDGRDWLAAQPLPETAREQLKVALAMIDALDLQMGRSRRSYASLRAGSRGARRWVTHYGIGELTAVTILAELGDCTRFSSSRHAMPRWTSPCTSLISVAHLGTSPGRDRRRCAGSCTRPPESAAAATAAQIASTYLAAKEPIGGNRACLSVARKLLKRSYHTLRELGEEALAPVALAC